jgi:GNAT superfamily N-acetyltransferase
MPSRVRLANLDDLDRLVSLDQIASREPTRAATVRLGIEADACWVADDGGGLLGYVLLRKTFFGFHFVELLHVEQLAQRHGVGRALIEQVEPECTTAQVVHLDERIECRDARLSGRLGYRWSGVIYNLDKDDPEFIFVKLLAR